MSKRALHELVKKVMLSVPLSLAPLGCSGVVGSGQCPDNIPDNVYGRYEADGGFVGELVDADGGALDGGALSAEACKALCSPSNKSCHRAEREVAALPDGGAADGGTETIVVCVDKGLCVGGRRPEGLAEVAAFPGASGAGRYLARMAHLEAASVPAFLRLAEELAALDAPLELVQAARAAAGDEVFHARSVGALARRFGGEVVEPEVAPFRPRGLLALAEENAVEGCVGETYGALVAAWQAAAAADPRVRGVMRAVAEDELRHAELAWAVAAWAEAMLAPAGRERVAAARQRAVAALEAEAGELAPAERAALGLPDAAQARALLAEARRSLWA